MGLQQEDEVAGVGGVSDFTDHSDQLGKSLFEATLLVTSIKGVKLNLRQ